MRSARIYYDKRFVHMPYTIYFPCGAAERKYRRNPWGFWIECEDREGICWYGEWGEDMRGLKNGSYFGTRCDNTAPRSIREYAAELADKMGYKFGEESLRVNQLSINFEPSLTD